ncbi:MAG: hypothetical protein FWE53_01505 [Firmicutes bacterium]|nr:hypothetical protein [Bacillota bacterium]
MPRKKVILPIQEIAVQVELFLKVIDVASNERTLVPLNNNNEAIEIMEKHKSCPDFYYDYFAKISLVQNGQPGNSAYVHISPVQFPERNLKSRLHEDLLPQHLPALLCTSGRTTITASVQEGVLLTTGYSNGKTKQVAMSAMRYREIDTKENGLDSYRFDKMNQYLFNINNAHVVLHGSPLAEIESAKIYSRPPGSTGYARKPVDGTAMINAIGLRQKQKTEANTQRNEKHIESVNLGQSQHFYGAAPSGFHQRQRERVAARNAAREQVKTA